MIQNLYLLSHSPASATVPTADPLPVSAQDVIPLQLFEEGEVFDPEDQPDPDTGDAERAIGEDHNYRENVHRVRDTHSGPGVLTNNQGR